jgi:hypothetical protein
MGLVLALFPAKVDISSRSGRLPAPALWPETLMEQLQYNLLFRWFVGMEMDEVVW